MSKLILVIDDDVSLTSMLEHMLKIKGYQVAQAHDGKSGLQAVKKQKPNLILLDVNMPGMNGMELLHKLKTETQTMKTPIIMLTASNDPNCMSESMGDLADKFISKPFDMHYLMSEIEKTLALQI